MNATERTIKTLRTLQSPIHFSYSKYEVGNVCDMKVFQLEIET